MKLLKTAIASALLAASMSANADGIVDLFSTNQTTLTDMTVGGGGLSSSVGNGLDPTILGGSRDLFVELLSSPAPGQLNARIGVQAGFLSFSVDAGATGTGWVQWDGADNSIALNPTGLGGANLSAFGTGFTVTTIFSDLGYEFVINAYTDATHWTSISFSAHATNVGIDSFIPFAAFENPALCGAINPAPGVNSITCAAGNQTVSFSNLGALELKIDPNGGTTSVDLIVDQVRVIPEPGSVALLASALLAGGLASRRRWKK